MLFSCFARCRAGSPQALCFFTSSVFSYVSLWRCYRDINGTHRWIFFHSKFFSLCISLDIDYLIFRWRSCSVIVTWAKKEKVRTKRASIVLDGNPSRSYGASPTIWDHLKIPRYSVPAALSVSTTGNAIFFYSTFITEQSSLYSLSAQSATFLPTVCLPVGSKI